jgi:hypothetical protein
MAIMLAMKDIASSKDLTSNLLLQHNYFALLTFISIILVHGLRGHPRHTWESSRKVPSTYRDPDTEVLSKRKRFKSFFKPKPSGSSTADQDMSEAYAVFWPQDYLIEDIPEARVWTYGYNTDVIGGLFQSNDRNSVSQHGIDLVVKIEREIENEV